MADPTIFWCSLCKKYHGGECGPAVASTEGLTLVLNTTGTQFAGLRSSYAQLLMDSKATILIGNKVLYAYTWDKDGKNVIVKFKEDV